MDALEIARWQFGITTVYHFMMVPLTIGLGLVVAVIQTLWYRTGKPEYLRMTKFWGKLFLINFIMGVATGIVQEFQFGMAWSEYSRFVGDVFGAPLAMEALLAFFVESTFLGLWIFGWKQLKPGRPPGLPLDRRDRLGLLGLLHHRGQQLDAAPRRRRNGQRPARHDRRLGRLHQQHRPGRRARTRSSAPSPSPAAFLLGIAWYHLWRRRHDGIDTVGADGKVIPGEAASIPGRDRTDHTVWIRSLRIGAVVAMISFAGTAVTGDLQGKLMFEQQPMKMAAAEAACHDGTGFSVLSVGNLGSKNCDDIVAVIEVPGILSFLAKGDFTTEVKGVNSLLDEYKAKYGTTLPDNPIYGDRAGQQIQYVPVMEVTYWGFRMMIGFGGLAALAALVALWAHPQGNRARLPRPHAPGGLRHPRTVRRQRRRLDLHRDGPPAVRRRPQPGPQRHRPGVHVHRRGRLTRASRPARS